jgi:hypothetical protein
MDFPDQYVGNLEEQFAIVVQSLPHMTDGEFSTYQSEPVELTAAGFARDFACHREARRRNIERWLSGGSNKKKVNFEHARAVIDALPGHALIDPESVEHISVLPVERFLLDRCVEDICVAVQERLTRKLNAFDFFSGVAREQLVIPELGSLMVTIHKTGEGIFHCVYGIEGEDFSISNGRSCGLDFLRQWNDTTLPGKLRIKALDLEMTIHGKDSIFVSRADKRFTNHRVHTAHQPSGSLDSDQLFRARPDLEENLDWRKDKTVLSWRAIEKEAILWLAEHVLNALQKASKPEFQISTPPAPEPFPQGTLEGPLYAFVEDDDRERTLALSLNPDNGYLDERHAIPRLYSLAMPGDRGPFPDLVHEFFVWVGVSGTGGFNPKVRRIGQDSKRSDYAAILDLKDASHVFIVDWTPVDECLLKAPAQGEATGTAGETLTARLARTLIPITEYSGGYKHPIVLVARNIRLDEVVEFVRLAER